MPDMNVQDLGRNMMETEVVLQFVGNLHLILSGLIETIEECEGSMY